MLKQLFRHYRARARLKARKAKADQIYNEMQSTWSPVKKFSGFWYKSGGNQTNYNDRKGEFIMVGETNLLGDRRLRLVHKWGSPNNNIEEHWAYRDAKKWEARLDELEKADDD